MWLSESHPVWPVGVLIQEFFHYSLCCCQPSLTSVDSFSDPIVTLLRPIKSWVGNFNYTRRSHRASIKDLNRTFTQERSQQTKLRFVLSKNVNMFMIAEGEAVSCADEHSRQTKPHILSSNASLTTSILVAESSCLSVSFKCHLPPSHYLLICCIAISKYAQSHHITGN